MKNKSGMRITPMEEKSEPEAVLIWERVGEALVLPGIGGVEDSEGEAFGVRPVNAVWLLNYRHLDL